MRQFRLLTSLVFSATLAFLAAPVQAADYSTPESTVAAYIEAVAARDFEAVIAASAAEEVSQNFDFVAFVDRLKSLVPVAMMPATDPLFQDINRASFTAQIARQVQFLAYGLMVNTDVVEGKAQPMQADEAAMFAALLQGQRLAGLKLVAVLAPMPGVMATERYRENTVKQAKPYGAEESTERMALLQFEGRYFQIGFHLMRYGESWKVYSQNSPLAGTSSMGAPTPTTPDDFSKWDD